MATSHSPPKSMLSLTVHPTRPVTSTLSRAEVPEPGPKDLLVRLTYSASNPKDIKFVMAGSKSFNSGEDGVGTLEAMGPVAETESGFSTGDRIAGMHQVGAPGGTYAEYALIPYHTAFKVPPNVSNEEAATIPLTTLTAGVTLFRRQGIAAPWESQATTDLEVKEKALIVYGATSALGTSIIKLAKHAGVGPIIAIGGSPSPVLDYVSSLLDFSAGDAIVSYREGSEKMTSEVSKALHGVKPIHGIDCISANKTWVPVSHMLDPESGILTVTSGAQKYEETEIASGVTIVYTFVFSTQLGAYGPGAPKPAKPESAAGDVGFAKQFMKWVSESLEQGQYSGHLRELIPGGLRGVELGLEKLMAGTNKGKKMVYKIGDTKE